DAMNLYVSVLVDRHLRDLRDITAKALVNSDAAAHAFCERTAPACLFGRELERPRMTRMLIKQRQPKLVRIFSRSVSDLVQKTLGRERRMRTSDSPPKSAGNSMAGLSPINQEILRLRGQAARSRGRGIVQLPWRRCESENDRAKGGHD